MDDASKLTFSGPIIQKLDVCRLSGNQERAVSASSNPKKKTLKTIKASKYIICRPSWSQAMHPAGRMNPIVTFC